MRLSGISCPPLSFRNGEFVLGIDFTLEAGEERFSGARCGLRRIVTAMRHEGANTASSRHFLRVGPGATLRFKHRQRPFRSSSVSRRTRRRLEGRRTGAD